MVKKPPRAKLAGVDKGIAGVMARVCAGAHRFAAAHVALSVCACAERALKIAYASVNSAMMSKRMSRTVQPQQFWIVFIFPPV